MDATTPPAMVPDRRGQITLNIRLSMIDRLRADADAKGVYASDEAEELFLIAWEAKRREPPVHTGEHGGE